MFHHTQTTISNRVCDALRPEPPHDVGQRSFPKKYLSFLPDKTGILFYRYRTLSDGFTGYTGNVEMRAGKHAGKAGRPWAPVAPLQRPNKFVSARFAASGRASPGGSSRPQTRFHPFRVVSTFPRQRRGVWASRSGAAPLPTTKREVNRARGNRLAKTANGLPANAHLSPAVGGAKRHQPLPAPKARVAGALAPTEAGDARRK